MYTLYTCHLCLFYVAFTCAVLYGFLTNTKVWSSKLIKLISRYGCHGELYLLLGLLVHIGVILTEEISVSFLAEGFLVVILTREGPGVVLT